MNRPIGPYASALRRVSRSVGIRLLASALLLLTPVYNARAQSTESAVGSPGASSATQSDSQVVQLEQGKPIEREMKGGETHRYQVTLGAGVFLRVVVDQRGIDVVVTLFGPDGKQLVEVDSPNGEQGAEPVSIVTEAAGSYRVQVRSLEKAAAAGRYEVKIEELRAATRQDVAQIKAEDAFGQAEQLRTQLTSESLRRALNLYELARSLMQEAGDRRGEGVTLNNAGAVYNMLGENQEALAHLNRALALLQSSGDQTEEANALNNTASVYASLGENHKALEYYHRGLALRRATGDRLREGNALSNIGTVYSDLGEKEKALDYLEQALVLRVAFGDRLGEATTLNGIGFVYYSSGDSRKALEYYGRAVSISRRPRGNVLSNMGLAYHSLGEEQKALDYLNQALKLTQAAGNREGETYVLNRIGLVCNSLGKSEEALGYLLRSLQLSRDVGNRGGEAAALHQIALAEQRQGRLLEARASIESSLDIVESLRGGLAAGELRQSYFATVQRYYYSCVDILMSLDRVTPGQDNEFLALRTSERARARNLLEMLREAHADIRQGVDVELLQRESSLHQSLSAAAERQARILNRDQTDLQSADLRKEIEQLLAQYQEVEAQIRAKSPRYAALTQPRPLSVKEIQQEVLDPDTLLLEYALGEERSYVWAVTTNSMKSFELPKKREIEEAAGRLFDLLTARNHREPGESAKQREARPANAKAQYEEAANRLSEMVLGPVAEQLDKKRLLIVGDGRLSYIPFAVLPSPPAQSAASPLHSSSSGAGARGTRQRTKDQLRPLIAEHEIVSLPSASALAVLRREIAGRKPAPRSVAVLADPVFDAADDRVHPAAKNGLAEGQSKAGPASSSSVDQMAITRSAKEVGISESGSFPRLLFTRREAEAIYTIARQKDTVKALDFDASKTTALGLRMKDYRIIHFATHGLLNNEHPELSGLVFSLVDAQGKTQNGFVRLFDIYNMDLNADLVVLSACQTALGKEVKGEGMMALTRGFMYAGAASVMASLWRVDDEATAELMKKFYEGVLRDGKRPAAALRTAQVWMQKQNAWRSPYYWAGFVLQGEWK